MAAHSGSAGEEELALLLGAFCSIAPQISAVIASVQGGHHTTNITMADIPLLD